MAGASRQAFNFRAIQPLRTTEVTVSLRWGGVVFLLQLALTAAVAPWHSLTAKALQVDCHLARQRQVTRVETLDLMASLFRRLPLLLSMFCEKIKDRVGITL
jgi:hypothetical protein